MIKAPGPSCCPFQQADAGPRRKEWQTCLAIVLR
jgi:hypothetical protein